MLVLFMDNTRKFLRCSSAPKVASDSTVSDRFRRVSFVSSDTNEGITWKPKAFESRWATRRSVLHTWGEKH